MSEPLTPRQRTRVRDELPRARARSLKAQREGETVTSEPADMLLMIDRIAELERAAEQRVAECGRHSCAKCARLAAVVGKVGA